VWTLVDGCSAYCVRDFMISCLWGPWSLAALYLLCKRLCDSYLWGPFVTPYLWVFAALYLLCKVLCDAISVGALVVGCSAYCVRHFVIPFLWGPWLLTDLYILCEGLYICGNLGCWLLCILDTGMGLCGPASEGTLVVGCSVYCIRDFMTVGPWLSAALCMF